MDDKTRIWVYDTTLRDGEQAPGFSMTPDEKVRLGKELEQLGVDVIEAGFPASSQDDYEASVRLVETIKSSRISLLSRALKSDIDVCRNVLSGRQGRIHVFSPVSDIHIREKLGTTPTANLESTREAIRYARNYCDDIQFGCEDASRADFDYLCRIAEACIDAGASTLVIADTVGYAVPHEFAQLISRLINNVPNIDKACVSVHCHNDLGLAVANSLAGLGAGARQVECTINGIGERAGNASLEEVVMCLKVRKQFFDMHTCVQTEYLRATSDTLADITGISVQPNKAIVGANAFRHEAGIHQAGVLKNPQTYEIMRPQDVGAPMSEIVVGKHSGKAGLRHRLKGLNLDVADEQFGILVEMVKQASAKSPLTDHKLFELHQQFCTHPLSSSL